MAKKSKSAARTIMRKASPKGLAMYPFLFKPSTKFKADGVYKISLVLKLDDPGVREYLQSIVDFQKEIEAGPKLPFTVDKDAGTATITFKSMEPPAIVDAKKQAITNEPLVGNGSVVRVSASFAAYEGFGGGVTAYLNAVQIIVLKVYIPGVDDFDEEDGFSAETGEEGETTKESDDAPLF